MPVPSQTPVIKNTSLTDINIVFLLSASKLIICIDSKGDQSQLRNRNYTSHKIPQATVDGFVVSTGREQSNEIYHIKIKQFCPG